jgi:hypothetical protein
MEYQREKKILLHLFKNTVIITDKAVFNKNQ